MSANSTGHNCPNCRLRARLPVARARARLISRAYSPKGVRHEARAHPHRHRSRRRSHRHRPRRRGARAQGRAGQARRLFRQVLQVRRIGHDGIGERHLLSRDHGHAGSCTRRTGTISAQNGGPKNPDAKGDESSPEASIFFVYYAKDGVRPEARPITFVYNGGPGSATVWPAHGRLGSQARRHRRRHA